MRLQILIATMNREDLAFIDKMNIVSDIVVGNQNGKISEQEYYLDGRKVKLCCSNQKGLSNNRNVTLQKSNADICLLADDDIAYLNNYEKIILNAFENYPDADIIIFNIYNSVKRNIIKKPFKVGRFNYMRFGSVRIAFRRKSIIDKRITFDSRFGAGAEIPMGEDTIFLNECLKAGLHIIAVPEYILTLTNERESTWFHGYDHSYFVNKGKLYHRLSSRYYKLLCLQDAIRHKKKYAEHGSWVKNYKLMISGV